MTAMGEFALAQQALIKGLNIAFVWAGDHDLYAMLADIAGLERDQAGLQRYAPLAEKNADRYDHRLYQAMAERAWGVSYRLKGNDQEAEERFKQALKIFQELKTRWQIGRTLYELGELAKLRGDLKTSREYFKEALAAFESIQAAPDASKTQRSMVELSNFDH